MKRDFKQIARKKEAIPTTLNNLAVEIAQYHNKRRDQIFLEYDAESFQAVLFPAQQGQRIGAFATVGRAEFKFISEQIGYTIIFDVDPDLMNHPNYPYIE
jgi:hypothetical protein